MGFHRNHGYFLWFSCSDGLTFIFSRFLSRQGWNKRKSIDTQLHSITMFSQRTTLINRTDTRLIRTTERRTNHITNVFKLISTKVTIKNNSSIDYNLCPKSMYLKMSAKHYQWRRDIRQLAFKHYHHLLKLFSSYYVCASDKYYIFIRFELPDKSFPIDISFFFAIRSGSLKPSNDHMTTLAGIGKLLLADLWSWWRSCGMRTIHKLNRKSFSLNHE